MLSCTCVRLVASALEWFRPTFADRYRGRMGDFRDLRAWREAKALVLLSRNAIRKLPQDERFALGDQWRRAAYSVALNIAEGASKRGPREFRRYLDTARGSLHEIGGTLVRTPATCQLRVPYFAWQKKTSRFPRSFL